MQPVDPLRTLAIRAHELASALAELIALAPVMPVNSEPARLRRAHFLAARVRALEFALALAEDDDALTIANELTDLEVLAETVLPREAPTVRPPPKASGTFVIEVRAAATNRLLAGSEPDSIGRTA